MVPRPLPRQTQPPRSERSEQRIFAPLESYIADGFVGCAALNASFLTMEPQADTTGAHVTPSDQRKQQPQTVATPNFEPDVFLSELDAKTLLIGDFAENGSWWTGGRANGQEREHRAQRGRSPQRSKSIASARSPRINWPELATWYQMVINAGGMWRRKWQAMSSGLHAEKKAIWDSISQDRLQTRSNGFAGPSAQKPTQVNRKSSQAASTATEAARGLPILVDAVLQSSSLYV